MKKSIRERARSIVFRYFISYIFIFLIPVLFSIGVYSMAFKINKVQTERINDALMEQVRMEIDQKVDDIKKILNQTALNDRVQVISRNSDNTRGKNQILFQEIVKELRVYLLADDSIDDLFVYLSNTDTVISNQGHMSAEIFYNSYYKSELCSLQEFMASMQLKNGRKAQYYIKDNNKKYILFNMASLVTGIGDDTATIVVSMDTEYFGEKIEKLRWDPSIIIYILDNNNQIISSVSDKVLEDILTYNGLEDKTRIYQEIDGKRYAVSIQECRGAYWKLVSMTPLRLLEKGAESIQLFTGIGLLICFILGAILSYVLAKQNYSPLKNVINLFKQKTDNNIDESKNEYAWLEQQISRFLKEHHNIKRIAYYDKRILKEFYIFQLMKYPFTYKDKMEQFKFCEIQLKAAYNMVILFKIPDAEENKDKLWQENKNLQLYNFTIANLFLELLGNDFNAEISCVDECVNVVVSLPEEGNLYLDILEETIFIMQQKIKELFGIRIVAAMGEIEKGIEGIHQSYLKASEAAEYLYLLEIEDIIYYADIKNVQNEYSYPIEVEQKVINTIRVGDISSAVDYIDRVFESNFNNKNVSKAICKCFTFDMIGTLMKAANVSGNSDLFKTLDIFEEMPKDYQIQEIRNYIVMMVEKLCQRIQRGYEEVDTNHLSKQIVAYINKNFRDPDLNISMTGLHFDMTPAYLSSLFKVQTGESLLDYINQVRIEEAKILLDEGYSVVDIAEKVGFRNSGALIRVFKKVVGITPGKYKCRI